MDFSDFQWQYAKSQGEKKILEDLAHDSQQPLILIHTTFFIYFDCIQLAKVCGHVAVAKSVFEYLSC